MKGERQQDCEKEMSWRKDGFGYWDASGDVTTLVAVKVGMAMTQVYSAPSLMGLVRDDINRVCTDLEKLKPVLSLGREWVSTNKTHPSPPAHAITRIPFPFGYKYIVS